MHQNETSNRVFKIFTLFLILGWIVDQTGRLDLVFVVSGMAFALGGLSMILSVKSKDRLRFRGLSQI